jgi:pilus assembly protein FimV
VISGRLPISGGRHGRDGSAKIEGSMDRIGAAVAVSLALFALACNRGPARAALAEAHQALAVARPELERYAPSQLARIDADVAEARARLARGRYTDALRIAQELPGRIARAVDAADARRRALDPHWARLAASTPPALEAASARLSEVEARRRASGNPGRAAALDAERSQLEAARAAWRRAAEAFAGGDLRAAIRLGSEAQAKLEALAARLETPGKTLLARAVGASPAPGASPAARGATSGPVEGGSPGPTAPTASPVPKVPPEEPPANEERPPDEERPPGREQP